MPLRDTVGVVDPLVEQAVWTAICSIPGCTMSAIHTVVENNVDFYEIAVDGWSPSLHPLAMQWMTPMRSAGRPLPPHELVDHCTRDILSGLSTQLRLQRERAAAGPPLGHARPIPLDTPDVHDVAHLHIDASLLAVFVREGAKAGWSPIQSIVEEVARPLARLHREALDHRGGHRLESDAIGVSDEDSIRTVGRQLAIGSHCILGSGPVLAIECDPIPETTAVHAVGQPLGRLVRVDPLLDDRIVESVEVDEGTTTIGLVPRPVRIGEMLA